MLRRLFRKRNDRPAEGATGGSTYAEGLLLRAAPDVKARFEAGESADPLAVLGEVIMGLEQSDGLSGPPDGDMAAEQFVRTYTTLLLDNDRQPPSLQMTSADIALPRALLKSFFTSSPTMQADASNVLRFIEQRFAAGRFGQSRLLLQLFDTDPMTRRNNERNLFYEEMILRFMSSRKTPGRVPVDDDDGALADVLARNDVRLNTFGTPPESAATWIDALANSNESSRLAAINLVPGPRWRQHWKEGSPVQALARQLDQRGARTFVANLTRAVYFITLAPGATGFEPLLPRYIQWVAAHSDMIPTRILPQLHRASTLDERSLEDALNDVLDEFFQSSDLDAVSFDEANVASAFEALEARLADVDISDVVEGEYDLGGMLLEQLFEFETGDPAITFRLNRLA